MDRYKKSDEYLRWAREVTPGAAQTLSKMPARFPEGGFPVALDRGFGAVVFDIDENKYVDWICGLGAMTLGYYHEQVTKAVVEQVYKGAAFSLSTTLEGSVAQRLCEMIPCAEMVRFVKTGSEATEAAIRVARMATGRSNILTVGAGYHGWHSWFQAIKPNHPGIPIHYERMINSFKYGETQDMLNACVANGTNIAAVILEPCLFEAPPSGFLSALREICSRYGIVLIFDEMVTGFRWRIAGGQEYFGVTPDLATFGKGCANGYPLAFLCGKKDLMEHASIVSGTFGGDAISLAACNAVLDVYTHQDIIGKMWEAGALLIDHFNDRAIHYGVKAVMNGYPCKPRIVFREDQANRCMSLFLQEAALNGALFHPGGFNVSAALSHDDIEATKHAVSHALFMVGKAIHTRDWSALIGREIQPINIIRN